MSVQAMETRGIYPPLKLNMTDATTPPLLPIPDIMSVSELPPPRWPSG